VKYTQQSIDDVKRASSMANVARLFCQRVKHESGPHYSAVCPFHKDSNPSLDIDDAKGVYICRACGAGGDALTMLERLRGVGFLDAIVELSTVAGIPLIEVAEEAPRIVAEWHYLTADGARAYSVKRWEPGRGRDGKSNGKRKSYSQHLADGHGGKSAVQLPYRLPQLVAARSTGAVIVLTEGEKAADAVAALGVVATTWAGGTGAVGGDERTTWNAQFAEHFRGAHLALWPDNDDVGRAAMAKIAAVLQGVAAELVTITTDLNQKGADAADWIAAGGTREGLQALILDARRVAVAKVVQAAPPAAEGVVEYLTDSGNAERWVRMHGKDFRYLVDDSCWLHWTGSHWEQGGDAAALHATKAVARSWQIDQLTEGDDARRVMLRRHADKSEAAPRRAAMLTLAASETGISVASNELDRDPWMLNCSNGTVDLRTGTLQAHRREDLCTRMIPVAFDPLATCPTFTSFLAQVLPDVETREYLGRCIGYAASGVIREHVFPVLWGQTGRNGKGTLVEAVFSALGPYATALPNDVILESRNDPHPNMFAQLLGVRFGVAAELRPSDKLNEGMLKKLTGGDSIRARYMGGEFFSFSPTQKLFLQTNYKPRVRGGDPALWARMRVIPFGVSFVGREDLTLKERLLRELPGILALIVRWCLDWQRLGLVAPAEVLDATADYREESDRVGQFLEERCERAAMGTIGAGVLWKAYRSWCEDRGEAAGGQNAFGTEVKSRGYENCKVSGERRYRGVQLRGVGSSSSSQDDDENESRDKSWT
jgi:putative DNA primase/helicase